jgi:hypothetical protein
MNAKTFNLSPIFTSIIIMAYIIFIGFAEKNADLLQIGFAAIIHYWIIKTFGFFPANNNVIYKRRIQLLKGSSIDQAMAYLIILIFGFPVLGNSAGTWGSAFGILLGISGIFVLAFGLILFLKKWDARNKSDYQLTPFYIELFIFYSLAYTFAAVASPEGGFISGLYPILEVNQSYQTANLFEVYSKLIHLFMDSIYYSVVIMTTLGDGSIQPNNIMKMVVISHVGFTVYVTVFGVAEYFSNQSSKDLKKELAILKQDLPKINTCSGSERKTSSMKVNSVSKRFHLSVKGLFTGRYE